MKFRKSFGSALAAMCLLATAVASHAQIINLATTENATITDIFGYNNSGDLSTYGQSYTQYPDTLATLNDGDTNSNNSLTSFGAPSGSAAFGGYENLVIPVGFAITTINLFAHTYGDGGWFGPSGDNNPNNPLQASELLAPTIQITTDNGTTWTDISVNNPYVADMTGAYLNSQDPEVTFTLDTALTAASGVDGIRIIGNGGGHAGPSNGFMAMDEIQLEAGAVPEPSTYALMALGLFGFVAVPRLRRAFSA